jgi:hypothetical protein
MSDFLNRFSLDAVKFNNQVLICLIIIWIVVLACAVHSVICQPFNKHQRWFWILLIVCLPGVGLLCYLPFALTKERTVIYYKRHGKR